MDRVVALGSQDQDREKIIRAALHSIDENVRSIGSEAEGVRHRLTTVQTEIQNLVRVLKRVGEAGLVSVQASKRRSRNWRPNGGSFGSGSCNWPTRRLP